MKYTYFISNILMFALYTIEVVASQETCLKNILQAYQSKITYYQHEKDLSKYNILKEINSTIIYKIVHWDYYQLRVFKGPKVTTVILSFSTVLWLEEYFIKTQWFSFSESCTYIFAYNGKTDDLVEVFEIAWRFNAWKALAVTKNGTVYSYNPVMTGYCDQVQLVSFKSCDRVSLPDTITCDIKNCTLRIHGFITEPYTNDGTFETNDGFVIKILKELIKRIELKAEYTSNRKLTYDIFDKVFIHSKGIDIFAGVSDIDFIRREIIYLCSNELAIFVPAATVKPPWMNTFLIFDVQCWIGIFISIVSLAGVWFLLKKSAGIVWSIFFTLSILLSPVPRIPRKHRILFMTWASMSIILTSSYCSVLISILFRPLRYPEISTLEEIIQKQYAIGEDTGENYFLWSEADSLPNLIDCIKNDLDCFNMLRDDNFAYGVMVRHLKYRMKVNGTMLLHKLYPYRYFMTFVTNRQPIIVDPLQKMAYRMVDHGIINYYDVYDQHISNPKYRSKFRPLTINHFLFNIILYLLLMLTACIVFTVELHIGH